MPYYVQLAYLLNPYLVASCAAKTTTGIFFKETDTIIVRLDVPIFHTSNGPDHLGLG